MVGKFSIQIMSTVGVLNKKTIPTKKCTTKYVHSKFLKTASYSGHFVVRIKAELNLRLKLDHECYAYERLYYIIKRRGGYTI